MPRAHSLTVMLLVACALAAGDGQPRAAAQARAGGLAGSPWASAQACEAAPRPRRTHGRVRIATWNVRWFPDGGPHGPEADHATDLEWLACAIAHLEVDAVALQEILLHERGRAAMQAVIASLDRRTGGRWQLRDDGCPADHQHVALLFDAARVRVEHVEVLGALNPTGAPCGQRLRPGLLARLRFGGGLDLALLALHLDSGTTRRDHGRRRASLAALASALAPTLTHERDLIVLGDLNTMGCRDCEPAADARGELAALEAELSAAGLVRLPASVPCSEYSGSHPSLLDHVAVAADMQELPAGARASIEGVCAALGCRHPPRDPRPAALERLSDHCPVVVELEDVDRDR